MLVPRIACERRHTLEFGNRFVVERELTLANRAVLVQLLELHEGNRREHVREIGLVSRNRYVVERAVTAPHQAKVSHRLGDSGVRINRLARGLATGSTLEFANRDMLADAISGRHPL